MRAQRRCQLECHATDQTRRHCAHAAQCSRHGRVGGPLGIEQRGRQCQHHGQREHACQRRQAAAQAKVAVTDHQRQIHHIGPRHDLGHGPVFQELLIGHPALFLDQFALHHCHHAAKALQRQPGEGPEQIRGTLRPGVILSVGTRRGGVQRHFQEKLACNALFISANSYQ
jgi:hypothetical protein